MDEESLQFYSYWLVGLSGGGGSGIACKVTLAKYTTYLLKGEGMNNMEVVDIIVLIDRSGSMAGMEQETIGAFNAFLKDQKACDGAPAVLTLVLFDHEEEVIHFRTPLSKVKKLTTKDYEVRGSTSMYDCIGNLIKAVSYANESGKAIVLIQSDGMENTSTLYSGGLIKKMIAEKETNGWDINFIGTGIDAITEGDKFGLQQNKCFSVDKNARGFELYGSTMSVASTSYRS